MLGGQIMVCRQTTLWLRLCRCLRSSLTCSWPQSQQRKQSFTAALESAGQVRRLPCRTWSRHYGHRRTEVLQMLSSAYSQQSGGWENKDIILCRCLGSMTSFISSWRATSTWPNSDTTDGKSNRKLSYTTKYSLQIRLNRSFNQNFSKIIEHFCTIGPFEEANSFIIFTYQNQNCSFLFFANK